MEVPSHFAIAEQMIAYYNAQDADAYVALMTEDACEASYRASEILPGTGRGTIRRMGEGHPRHGAPLVGRDMGRVPLHQRGWSPSPIRGGFGATYG